MKILVKILFLCCVTFSLGGQIPHFKNHPFSETYKQTVVNTILEAKDGFLWFGTSNGLFRYNGLEYNRLIFADTFLLENITALFEDSAQTIWIGSKTGSIFFIEKNTPLQKWMPEEGTPAAKITGFAETKDGIFWISTYGEGVYYYQDNRMFNLDIEDGLTDIEVYSMIQHRENHVLVATDGGISVCKIEQKKKQINQLTTADGLSDEIVKSLLKGRDGNFWVATYDYGIDFWNEKKQIFESLTPEWDSGEINTLEVFEEKELWIGTEGNGLFRLDLETNHLQKINLPEFENSKVYDLHKDVEGNLWVINNTNGVSSANRQFEEISNKFENIQAVLIDRQNRVWLGTPKGLFLMENKTKERKSLEWVFPEKNINVVSLFEDIYGHIWIGTFGQGLYCYDLSKNDMKFFSKADGLLNDNILSIDGTSERIWLATLQGVFEFDVMENVFSQKAIFRNYTHDNGLGSDFIYKVFVCSDNRTWFGTDGKGISVLDDGKITNYSEANGIQLKTVYTITQDQQGSIWFGTAGSGIFEFDGENFDQLNVKEGIRDLEITSLVTDSLGNILIVHPSGIDILNPKTKHLIYYDEEVGLGSFEPVLNSYCIDKRGNIWLGSNDRLLRYSALNEVLEIHPRNRIEKVNIFFEPIDYQKINAFDYSQNNLVFDYIGLWFTDPEKVEYRYQLEGYDLNWIHSKDKQAHYSNLPPGSYVFKITSTENGEFNQEPITSYAFMIKAPYWQQGWFLGLCILALVGMIYSWVEWKSNRLQREADLQKERIQSQLEVLKSQINPHFLFNSFNTLLTLVEDETEAAEYVEKLSDFYRSLLQYQEKDLIPLQEELNLLRNFEFLMKKRFGENIHVNIPNVDERIAYVPPLTLQMLVENAIKHNVVSKRKPLHISLAIEENTIIVTNNLQKKISKEKSTHFGLRSIQSRYELLGKKKVIIEETEIAFKVTIPIFNK